MRRSNTECRMPTAHMSNDRLKDFLPIKSPNDRRKHVHKFQVLSFSGHWKTSVGSRAQAQKSDRKTVGQPCGAPAKWHQTNVG